MARHNPGFRAGPCPGTYRASAGHGTCRMELAGPGQQAWTCSKAGNGGRWTSLVRESGLLRVSISQGVGTVGCSPLGSLWRRVARMQPGLLSSLSSSLPSSVLARTGVWVRVAGFITSRWGHRVCMNLSANKSQLVMCGLDS
jgi:hypothetical protein